MAFQIIPETSFASSLGQQIGGGLSAGLQQLAQQKLQEIQREKMVPGLQALLPNVQPDQLKSLLKLDPALMGVILKQKLQEPNQLAFQQEVAERTGGAPAQEPGKPTVPLTPKQQLQLGQFDIQKQTLEEKKQKAIREANAPYIKRVTEKADEWVPIKRLTTEIKELMESPDIQWGTIKSLTPARFQNSVTQTLVSKLKELVLEKGKLGGGVLHKSRLEMENLAKPDLWQKPATIKYLINSLDKKADEDLMPRDLIKEVIEEHGGEEPRGLETLVDDRLAMKSLPPASEFSDDAIVKVGKRRFGIKNGEWVKL